LNSKRRELDRDAQLWNFENDAANAMKYLVSYLDQITKLAFEIGKNEEQARELIYEHKNLMASVDVSHFLLFILTKYRELNRAIITFWIKENVYLIRTQVLIYELNVI
jgi:hypothetical protein